MGLARIAIAVLAVTLALGLVIVGGVSLWGALTKDASKTASSSPDPSSSGQAKVTPPGKHASSEPRVQSGNEIDVECLVAQCPIFVAGPGATDVIYQGSLVKGETQKFSETRVIMKVDDASTVNVTVNGQRQPRGRRGQEHIYKAPAKQ
ncbi:hypothetical protein GCM10023196_054690 [Actinoallomurus vinaceus]|uniref:DUF4115 domain-containing protein n=1 Tax=Actinoallomurus vinaceus TaxID=1080074 RepID=A0ABP8UFP1_9ACTN